MSSFRPYFFFSILLLSSPVWAIDCNKASTATEKTICAHDDLQILDEVLNENYHSQPITSELKKQQKTWLQQRNQCKDKPCLVETYIKRIKALSGAENITLFPNISEKWAFVLSVYGDCQFDYDYSFCEGRGTLDIVNKTNNQLFQRINEKNVFIELDQQGKATSNLIEIYGENNSGLVVDDINFDSYDDLAIRNGNDGAYGGPSYDIFLYDPQQRQFILNDALTELGSSNLGLFSIDAEEQTLTTFTKDGCCWHQWSTYLIEQNEPVLTNEITIRATGNSSEMVTTIRSLVNGKWQITEEYDYPEE